MAIFRIAAQCGAHTTKRRGDRVGDYVAQRLVGLALADAVLLGEPVTADGYVAHRLDHVGKSFLHAPEVIESADQNHDCDQDRNCQHRTRSRCFP